MGFITDIIVPCLCIIISSVAFSIEFNIRGKKLIFATLGGTLAWIVYLLSTGIYVNDIPQYFLGAAAVSIYSEILARVNKVPATVYLAISLIPLVPGGEIYYTMVAFINGNADLFLQKLMYTFGIAGAIALGVFAVTSIFRIIAFARANKIKLF